MHVRRHHVAKRREDGAMTSDTGEAGKLVRHDSHVEVPLSVLGPGMPGVQVALVLDQQPAGFEGVPKQ